MKSTDKVPATAIRISFNLKQLPFEARSAAHSDSGHFLCGFDNASAGWHRERMRRVIGPLAIALGLAAARGAEAPLVPDFRLSDVNFNSVRKNARVSPRDYLLQVSGYYFGAAG